MIAVSVIGTGGHVRPENPRPRRSQSTRRADGGLPVPARSLRPSQNELARSVPHAVHRMRPCGPLDWRRSCGPVYRAVARRTRVIFPPRLATRVHCVRTASHRARIGSPLAIIIAPDRFRRRSIRYDPGTMGKRLCARLRGGVRQDRESYSEPHEWFLYQSHKRELFTRSGS
jgi:hypothetical protein